MKLVIAFLLLSFSSPSFAAVDVFRQYDARIGSDLDAATSLSNQMKTGYRGSCPDLKTADMSSCFKSQISKIEVKSAAQLALLIKAGVNASLFDHSKGYNVDMVKLLLAENILAVFEKVDVTKFHVNSFLKPKSAAQDELKILFQNEEVALSKLYEEALPLIKEASKNVESIPQTDAAGQWRVSAALRIEDRLSKLKPEQFKFKNFARK